VLTALERPGRASPTYEIPLWVKKHIESRKAECPLSANNGHPPRSTFVLANSRKVDFSVMPVRALMS
jgi:hypothetical protein